MRPCTLHRPLPLRRCAVLLGIATLLGACGTTQTLTTTAFWQEAAGDPLLAFEPALPLPSGVTTTTIEFDAEVKALDHARRPGVDHNVELRLDSGERLVLHYRIGAGRALPLKSGETVHMAIFRRGPGPERAPADGLLMTGLRPGLFGQRRQILAVVDVDGVVPRMRLPPALAAIQPTDVLVYQTAQHVEGQCYLSLAHNQLAVADDAAARKSGRLLQQTVAPGGRLQVANGEASLDVLMLENRRVVSTTCRPEPLPSWSFAALWVAEAASKAEVKAAPLPAHPAP